MSTILIPLGTVSPYPKDNKNCPGYLIEHNNKKILLDCGNGCTRLLNLQEDLNDLTVFISHLHPDHCADLTTLFDAALVYNRVGYLNNRLKVYLPSGDRRLNPDFGSPWIMLPPTNKYLDENILLFQYLKSFEDTHPVEIIPYTFINEKKDGMEILTAKTEHNLDTNAFKITTEDGVITYSADTGVSDTLTNFVKNSDMFICESTFLRGQTRLSNTHLYACEAAKMAKKANVNQLLLTHFWPELDSALYVKEAKEVFENVEALEEGKKLVLRRKEVWDK